MPSQEAEQFIKSNINTLSEENQRRFWICIGYYCLDNEIEYHDMNTQQLNFVFNNVDFELV